jgi:hypothetical protein
MTDEGQENEENSPTVIEEAKYVYRVKPFAQCDDWQEPVWHTTSQIEQCHVKELICGINTCVYLLRKSLVLPAIRQVIQQPMY